MGSVAVGLVPKPIINLGELLKLIGLPTERERVRVFDRANDLLREVVAVIDGLVALCIECKTAVEFRQVRESVFPQYCLAVRALGDLARIILTKQTIEQLSVESFSEMESDFRDLGASTIGADLTERGMFTIWTLRKVYDLGKEIESRPLPKENASEDVEKARDFLRVALWTRLHVDCLAKSMRTKKPVYPEVAEPIRDGLRAAVDAYAHMRLWADLRNPRPEIEVGPVEWSDEDDCLLADSMRDLDQS